MLRSPSFVLSNLPPHTLNIGDVQVMYLASALSRKRRVSCPHPPKLLSCLIVWSCVCASTLPLWLTGVCAAVILSKATGRKLINPSLVIAPLHLASSFQHCGSVGLKPSALNWIKESLFTYPCCAALKKLFSPGSLEHKSQFSSRWQGESQGHPEDRSGTVPTHLWGTSHSTALFWKPVSFLAIYCLGRCLLREHLYQNGIFIGSDNVQNVSNRDWS